MKLITTAAITLFLLASASAQTNRTGALSSLGVAQAPGSQSITILRRGAQPSRPVMAGNFTGSVRVDPLFQANAPARASGSLVTFEPGARTAWHTHPLGQVLIVTAGLGRVQRWGDPIEDIRQGDVVWIPPGQKHWHGAAPQSSMAHIAISESLDGESVEWMEKVSDAQYSAPSAAGPATPASGTQPRPSQRAIGDFAPKLADLTDNVLYGDVWERPELSKRDRSLVTVAALIAMNRPEQLRSHLVKARENGVKQEEVVETITHLAFYAGWPNAVTAVAVAKEVFEKK
ncbi:MAG TPA: carboxymuconolactone decarboxylase family protein [Candidatus Limnocylindrales bacterium]|nr:carboxymuconolactone decarboxylase family protein [Candidatus Limnocylindrales bacterium]